MVVRHPTLWTLKAARVTKRRWFWPTVHILLLALQWATIQAAPITMQKANAQGWWAFCITAKGP